MKNFFFFVVMFCDFRLSITLVVVHEFLQNLTMTNFRSRQNYDCNFVLHLCLQKNTPWSKIRFTVTFYRNTSLRGKKSSFCTT